MSSTRGEIDAVVGLYAENTTPELPSRRNKKKAGHETNYNQNPDAIVPYYTTHDDNEETISDRPDSYLNPVPRSPQSPPTTGPSNRPPPPPIQEIPVNPQQSQLPESHNTLRVEENIHLPLNNRNGTGSNRSNVSRNRSNISNNVTVTNQDLPPIQSRDIGSDPHALQYYIEETPPWYLCILLGFQHYLVMFGATVANPLTVAPYLCMSADDSEAKSQLIGTILFCSGIATLLQSTLGTRLPIVQGGTFTFVAPTIAILALDHWKCPDTMDTKAISSSFATPGTATYLPGIVTGNMTPNSSYEDMDEPLWKPRIREIQGAIMVASIFQVVIGFSGILGFVMRFIGPLTIAPTIALAGLALFDVASYYASKQWWITLVTVILIAMFSQYTKNIGIPCCEYQKGHGLVRISFPLFRLFPIILAIAITWIICLILTVSGVFPDGFSNWGYENKTDLSIKVLEESPWFRVPYPGQWGMPTVSTASVFGMLSGVLASMVESIGDYYACARISRAPPPPMHAINRGIGMEGIGCILAGAFGSGSGTTSYSENIGAIGITKVASRRVIQVAGVIMLLCGVFGKFGALFVTIPVPIIGGIFIVMFGMITAVGISNLQFVDLNSSRNLFIIGFSFFFGLTLPKYLQSNINEVNTGNIEINQILTVLLSTSMFVGGMSGFILDNTIPGTKAERGLIKWRQELIKKKKKSSKHGDNNTDHLKQQIYEIPVLTEYLKRWSFTRYVPFLPTFDEELFNIKTKFPKRKRKKGKMVVNEEDGNDAGESMV